MFQDMLNTIILGDSYKLIKEIPDNSIDLIIIDPPYEIETVGSDIINIAKSFRDGVLKELVDLKIAERNKLSVIR